MGLLVGYLLFFFITAVVRHEHECEGSALKGELLWNM